VRVSAGFPSPADDYVDRVLDLNELAITNPPATYLVRVGGNSMIGAGIHDGDVLVVDRSLDPDSGDVIIAALDGELTVKRVRLRRWAGGQIQALWLVPEHPDYPLIEVTAEMDFEVWGVVTYVLHAVARPKPAKDHGRGHGGD